MPNILPTFSFKNKVREALYIRRDNLKSKFSDQIFGLDIKSVAYPFVEKLGVKTPYIFFKNMPLEKIKNENINDSFVLKPEQAHSSLGVYLCHYDRNSDTYEELLTTKKMTKKEIFEEAEKIMLEKKISNKWIIEQLVYPEDGQLYAIDDWKFYCFYGKVGLILQKHKSLDGEISYKLYDCDIVEATKTGKYIGKIDNTLPISKNMQEMIEVAKLLSSKIPLPFIRVDLFSSSEGVVFGEFTPFPGGFSMFWKTWDAVLGKMWVDAEARLDRDIKTGKFQELYSQI
ncbi:hypothetical protein A6M14_06985 [Acinetobacter sp. Ac_877]|uniref:ATP-grasp fold amidoligase family protein n=1 Tax=Acinetobacter portensis TaxID=1839785 RepID=UPI00128DC451|nr:ATP-grasp fold amidoligase family protein [Acinetobacter portensis]MPW41133.1 hypothetical protein [Acinetobacter portensis]